MQRCERLRASIVDIPTCAFDVYEAQSKGLCIYKNTAHRHRKTYAHRTNTKNITTSNRGVPMSDSVCADSLDAIERRSHISIIIAYDRDNISNKFMVYI